MKRLMKLAIVGLIVVAGIAVGLWQYLGRSGSSDLEQWIGQVIVGVLESYIRPKVSFESLDYEAPYSVEIRGLEFIDGGEPFLAVKRLRLELAEIPIYGEPVQIKSAELEEPMVRLIPRASGGLLGWSGFVKAEAASAPESIPKGSRLSDILVLRHVSITDGQVSYESPGEEEPMVLPGIDMSLETPPAEDEPGWYGLAGILERGNTFKVDFDGRINLDTSLLTVQSLVLHLALDESEYQTFPPAVQAKLREYRIRGTLEARMSASCPLTAPATSEGELTVKLSDAGITLGKSTFPIEQFDLDARFADASGRMTYLGKLLGGTTDGTVTIGFQPPCPLEWRWGIDGILIEKALEVTQEGDSTLEGRVTSQGQLAVGLTADGDPLSGQGELAVEEGTLVNLPMVASLHQLMKVIPTGEKFFGKDHAKLVFDLKPTHFAFSELSLTSGLLAMHGEGDLYYDGRLDLVVRAGLLGGLTSKLGQLGDVIDAVGDSMISYDVTGQVGEPQVTARPLNIR